MTLYGYMALYGYTVLYGPTWLYGPLCRLRNSGERMSGRGRTGVDFYSGGWGGSAHLSAHRGAPEGRPAHKIQAASVENFFDLFLTLF